MLFLDCDLGLIVFELKLTGRDPVGRQIIALVAFTITLAFYPRVLLEGDKRTAIVLLVFAAISICEALFLKMSQIPAKLS